MAGDGEGSGRRVEVPGPRGEATASGSGHESPKDEQLTSAFMRLESHDV